MTRGNLHRAAVFTGIGLFGAGLDMLTKGLVFSQVQEGQEVPIISGFFDIGCARNPGVVFSLGTRWPDFWLVISILAVPAILAVFLFAKRSSWVFTICLGMILAGTLGNMYDRLSEGAVRDFIKFYVVTADGTQAVWPLFNLADSFICVGVFLMTVEMLFFDERAAKKSKDLPSGTCAA